MARSSAARRAAVNPREMALISLFAVLAIIGGKIVIPVFSIPFTLQFQVCLLTGLLLGARRALAAQAVYLALGLIGLPVFALGGGIGYVLQPSFGYLPGMLVCAGLVGWLADKADPARRQLRLLPLLAINYLGLFTVYLFGVSYLYLIQNFYAGQNLYFLRAVQIGLLPYLLTDSLHVLIAAAIAPALRRSTRPFILRLKGVSGVRHPDGHKGA